MQKKSTKKKKYKYKVIANVYDDLGCGFYDEKFYEIGKGAMDFIKWVYSKHPKPGSGHMSPDIKIIKL